MIIVTQTLIFACENISEEYADNNKGHYIGKKACSICKVFTKGSKTKNPVISCSDCIFSNSVDDDCEKNYTFPSVIKKNKPSSVMLLPKTYYSPLRAEVHRRIVELLQKKGKASYDTMSDKWLELKEEIEDLMSDVYKEFLYRSDYSPEL